MPGRWNERERDWQDWRAESDWRGRDRGQRERERWQGGEQRSFGRGRVFGERDTGAEYNRPPSDDWQQRDYGGVSPAMRRGDYESDYRAKPRFESQDYTRGGRYYGDDAQARIYREEYGQGGREYGPEPRGYDEGRRFGARDLDERYDREMRNPPSGGTGGYDYERGYGDGGRSQPRYSRPDYGRSEYGRSESGRGDDNRRPTYARSDRDQGGRDQGGRGREDFEERAHETGDFFRRTGQKISNWFSGEGGREDDDRRRYDEYRGARGLGPKGYQRSDDRINEEVHQHLTDDSWVDASNISASVSDGEVTLSGTVDSREAKHRAERIVEDLSGVKHVQNNLRVSGGNYFTSAPSRGYGDTVEQSQMRNEPLKEATDGTAQKPQAFQQSGQGQGQAGQNDGDAASRSTTRRS